MTLRTRLVGALLLLLAVGLLVYGIGAYRAFEQAERARFDEELRDAAPTVANALDGRGPDGAPDDGDRRDGGPGGPARVPPGTYARLLDDGGGVVGETRPPDAVVLPDLDGVDADSPGFRTIGSVEGDARWRLLVADQPDDAVVLLATPLRGLEESLRGLLTIQVVAGFALLAALAGGAWVVLGIGLRPLERMAATAASIRAGSLDRRVEVPPRGTEVAQLATAVNGMLDELEHAFREREATEARLRRFLADASHELRTPLTSIRGFAELLRIGRDDPHVDHDTAVRRIEAEAERMRRLVEDLLTLARLDERRATQVEPVDLAVLAADACSDAAASAPGRPIVLDAPDPVPVLGDEGLLRQAVANLVGNALRHTSADVRVEVGAHVDGRDAVLVVRDHGGGLDPVALQRVFERFWQADPSRAGAGAGLGLSIVHAVAAEHEGTVEADNAGGGGAVFRVRLPLADAGQRGRRRT